MPNRVELKGRPPLRACPSDFDVIFVEQGRIGCESWYRASRLTVNRWMDERGAKRLIDARAAYVAHQRANGQWMTRSTRLVEVRSVRPTQRSQPIRDRRVVSFTLARHAAQFLRVIRNGGFIVSPTPQGDWWVGSKRLSAAQMLDLACNKGFDRVAAKEQERHEEADRAVTVPVTYASGEHGFTTKAQRSDGSVYLPNNRKRRNLQKDSDGGLE